MTTTRYISVAETAKLVRKQLKAQFPGQKFSVRSDSYSGGASINVYWTDGPVERLVDAVVSQFVGGDFDGMIDLKTSHSSWLHADGTAGVAYDAGTVGSRGVHESRIGAPKEGSELVSFGADFIFTNRQITDEHAASFEFLVTERCSGIEQCHGCGHFLYGKDGFVVNTLDWRGGYERTVGVCSIKCGGKAIAIGGVVESVNA